MAADEFYATTWGSIRLWCSRITTENSRTQVVHELATGDLHPVQDRGLATIKVKCDLLFDEMAGETQTPIARFKRFKGQIDRGDEEILTHPIDGSFLVHVGTFSYVIDEDNNIVEVSIEFIANDEVVAIHPAAVSSSPVGVGLVGAAAADLANALEDSGITSTLPADAVAVTDTWIDGETVVSTRDILNQTAELSDALSTLIDTEDLEGDLALWDAYQSAIMFGATLRAAAMAATSETPAIFFMRINAPTSVLALVVRVYPATEAEDRERQIRSLNDLRFTGGLIDPGTELAMPARSSGLRAI